MRSLHVQALNASKLEFLTELCSYSVALRSALRSATVWAWTESIMCIELIVIWDGMGVWTQKLREKLQASYRETTWSYYMKATGKLLHVENSGERRLFVASRYSVHRAAHRPPSGSWVVHVEICINSILLRDAIGLKTDPANRKKTRIHNVLFGSHACRNEPDRFQSSTCYFPIGAHSIRNPRLGSSAFGPRICSVWPVFTQKLSTRKQWIPFNEYHSKRVRVEPKCIDCNQCSTIVEH